MNAHAQMLYDLYHDCDPADAPDDIKRWAHEMAVKRQKKAEDLARVSSATPVNDAADILGTDRGRIVLLIQQSRIWWAWGKSYSERTGRHYRSRVVDVDEVRDALEKQDAEREKKTTSAKVIAKALDAPPPGLVRVIDMRMELGTYPDALRMWCRSGLIKSAKKVAIRHPRGVSRTWYADRDDVIETARRQVWRALGTRGNRMKRDRSVPETDLANEIWSGRPKAPEVHAFWEATK